MKTSMIGKYAALALFSLSLIALNNCGSQSDSTRDPSYTAEQNGPASDLVILPSPPFGYTVAPGLPMPSSTIETACSNGVDDDGNGLKDCQDPNCWIHPECSQFGPPLEDVVNSDTLTVYPNGLLVPEAVAFLNSRGVDDDDHDGWLRSKFFDLYPKDCWVVPYEQDPYYTIPLGEALVAGPDGPIGPQLFPASAIAYYGPRAGLINECDPGFNIFEHGFDDDDEFTLGVENDDDDDSDDGEEDDGEEDDRREHL